MNALFQSYIILSTDILQSVFIIAIGLGVVTLMTLFVIDAVQSKDAIRKNYPLIGRARYLFTTLGEFFRQYFFAMDREEMPFNRAEREWVYRAASNHNNTIAFGSTKNIAQQGSAIFVNCAFPVLDKEAAEMQPVLIGPYCSSPFKAKSIFNISAMSYGALSAPAITALAKGAKIAGCWMNTGEGGLSNYHLEGGCDIVFQIGTAKYGVRDEQGELSDQQLKKAASHEQVKMFEIKLSQGAKPGKGGILPGIKVTPEIALIRGIPEGMDSISPDRHPEVNTPEALLDMINHIRSVTGKPVGFKAVISSFDWIETLLQEIHKRGIEQAPDFITIDSGDGGTGAAPMPLMDNVGLLVKESMPIVANLLHKYGLKERIRLICSGKLITPSGVAMALATGADFVVSARGFMFSLGCIQALKCNKNTCPTGITTHNKHLQKGLNPNNKAVKVANYALNITHEVEVIAHSCGASRPRLLQRSHVRIVQADGRSIPMDQLLPYPEVLPEYVQK